MRRIILRISVLALLAALAPARAEVPAQGEVDRTPPVICWQIVDPQSFPGFGEPPAAAAGSEVWLATVSGRRYQRLTSVDETRAAGSGRRAVAGRSALEVRSATPQAFLFFSASVELRPGWTLAPGRALWISASDAGVGVQGIVVRVVGGESPNGARLEVEARDLADRVSRVELPSLQPLSEVRPGRFCSVTRVLVPSLVDLEPLAARALAEERGLTLEIAGEDLEPPAGAAQRIVEQVPGAGVEVLPDSVVRGVVAGFTRVPDLVASDLEEAREALLRRGLGLKQSVVGGPLPTGAVYRVRSQDPNAGTEVTLGEEVEVGVVALLRVPSLVGMEAERAQGVLLASGFLGEAETDSPRLRGELLRVRGQSPSAGSLAAAGSPVLLELARLVLVPALDGLDPGQAAQAVARRGLELTPDEQVADAPAGSLFELVEQLPAAGAEVAPGTAVAVRFAVLVPVPELRGLTFAEARRALAAGDLGLGGVDWRVGSALGASIVGQGQSAGAHVEPGTAIGVALSKPYVEEEVVWPWRTLVVVLLMVAGLGASRSLRRPKAKFEVKADADLAGLRQSARSRAQEGSGSQLDIRLRPVFDAGVQTVSIEIKE